MLEAVFLLRAPSVELELRVESVAPRVDAAQRALVLEAAALLRIGLERRDPAIVSLALELESVLNGRRLARAIDHSTRSTMFRELERLLEHALVTGRLRVTRRIFSQLVDLEEVAPELPPLPPPRLERGETSYEVRLVDETGQGINRAPVELSVAGVPSEVTTNATGIALLDGVLGGGADARVLALAELDAVLDERWTAPRAGKPNSASVRADLEFYGGKVGPIALRPAVENTIVLRPPLGRLHVELFDKWGRVRHARSKFEISGPMSFSGETDDNGTLTFDDVFPGDYRLKLGVRVFEGTPDETTHQYESPLVVLEAGRGAPEVRLLGAVPSAVLARLHGHFNTNKAFLLPTGLAGMAELRTLYAENNPGELLVVGHADTAGGSDYNEKLSFDRARATIAFLNDDVDAWLAFYDPAVTAKQRWGRVEDGLMLRALPDFTKRPKGEDPVRWFQRTRSLTVDGKAGPETRRQLIGEYMGLDGLSLSRAGLELTATPHGAGEHFPLDDAGRELDAAPEDEQRQSLDRRVELYFFDPELGIVPPPPGDVSKAGSAEYPEWRRRAIDIRDFEPGELGGPKLHFVELADAHFRLNSAVVLPVGQAPSDEQPNDDEPRAAFSSSGAFASALVFAQGNPLKRALVAGHTDTSGSEGENQALSEERAEVALCCLLGTSAPDTRERFATLCDGRHLVSDQKQILAWAARAFGFDCDPGAIDDDASTLRRPVEGFQRDYNQQRAELGVPDAEALEVDGAFGPETWGAVFDCYEVALAKEISSAASVEERAAELAELRRSLVFVDDETKSAGFSEHWPIDELGVDGHRSEENRRVEVLFFDPDEEPELAVPPEDSEIYLPGIFIKNPVPIGESALDALERLSQVAHQLRSNSGCVPLANLPYRLDAAGRVFTGTTDDDGLVTHDLLPPGDHELEVDGRKTTLATLPRGTPPVLHVVAGFFLDGS